MHDYYGTLAIDVCMVPVCLGGGGSYEASGYDFGEIHEVKTL
jgi:hypothetical protein